MNDTESITPRSGDLIAIAGTLESGSFLAARATADTPKLKAATREVGRFFWSYFADKAPRILGALSILCSLERPLRREVEELSSV